MKKHLSVLLTIILALALLAPQTELAGSYASTIRDIHSSFVSGNRKADSAPQQQVNGAYRCVELLEVWAYQVGVASGTVSDIHSSYVSGNRRADSAPQQLANGLYRGVELLEGMGLE